MIERDLEFVLASPSDHERLVAETYYKDLYVATVSEERGAGLFEVETPGTDLVESLVIRKLDLDKFLYAVRRAREILLEGRSS